MENNKEIPTPTTEDIVQNDEETQEMVNPEEDKPFYQTTYGIITISFIVLIILVLILKYTGIFDIMSFF
jgi:hypothetical protein